MPSATPLDPETADTIRKIIASIPDWQTPPWSTPAMSGKQLTAGGTEQLPQPLPWQKRAWGDPSVKRSVPTPPPAEEWRHPGRVFSIPDDLSQKPVSPALQGESMPQSMLLKPGKFFDSMLPPVPSLAAALAAGGAQAEPQEDPSSTAMMPSFISPSMGKEEVAATIARINAEVAKKMGPEPGPTHWGSSLPAGFNDSPVDPDADAKAAAARTAALQASDAAGGGPRFQGAVPKVNGRGEAFFGSPDASGYGPTAGPQKPSGLPPDATQLAANKIAYQQRQAASLADRQANVVTKARLGDAIKSGMPPVLAMALAGSGGQVGDGDSLASALLDTPEVRAERIKLKAVAADRAAQNEFVGKQNEADRAEKKTLAGDANALTRETNAANNQTLRDNASSNMWAHIGGQGLQTLGGLLGTYMTNATSTANTKSMNDMHRDVAKMETEAKKEDTQTAKEAVNNPTVRAAAEKTLNPTLNPSQALSQAGAPQEKVNTSLRQELNDIAKKHNMKSDVGITRARSEAKAAGYSPEIVDSFFGVDRTRNAAIARKQAADPNYDPSNDENLPYFEGGPLSSLAEAIGMFPGNGVDIPRRLPSEVQKRIAKQ